PSSRREARFSYLAADPSCCRPFHPRRRVLSAPCTPAQFRSDAVGHCLSDLTRSPPDDRWLWPCARPSDLLPLCASAAALTLRTGLSFRAGGSVCAAAVAAHAFRCRSVRIARLALLRRIHLADLELTLLDHVSTSNQFTTSGDPPVSVTLVVRPQSHSCFGNATPRRDVLFAVLVHRMVFAGSIHG